MDRMWWRVILVGLWAVAAWGCAVPRTEPSSPTGATFDYEGYLEARRELSRFDPGGVIHHVRWSEDGGKLFYTRLDERLCFDLAQGELVEVEEAEQKEGEGERRGNWRRRRPGRGRQRDREPSPDEKWVAVCEDWNVVIEAAEGEERIAVTTEGDRKFRYGTANWVYGEELDQVAGMWWSPDSRKLVFYEFDEREVADYYLLKGLTERRPEILREGYSKPGEANPKVSLLAYDLASQDTTRLATAGDAGEEWYIYNVRFTPDGSEVLFNRTNRHQNVLEVAAADPETGMARVVVRERQETWQENRPYMKFLADGERFIWETEKTGWRQYELRHLDGRLLCTLTRGSFPAIRVQRVDESASVMYYTAYGGEHPLNAHLFRVNLDGTGQRRLTQERANHTVRLSPDGKWFITRFGTVEQPPTTALYDTEGRRIAILAESDPARIAELGYPEPELFSFKADDGETDLYGWLYKPRGFDPSKRYPLVVDVYGGPGSKGVRNSYRAGHATTYFGLLVAKIDNRGTGGRGKSFLGAAYQKLGDVDIEDQAAGARYLGRRPYVDATRVGIYGHSYGGTMAALGVLKYPEVFQVAVAQSGATDWRNYDTIYTERYMRTPEENPEGYDGGACLTYAGELEGKLLIQHGMLDDNVHPTNAWQLVKALNDAGKSYELVLYPNAGHGLTRGASEDRLEFLFRHLAGSADGAR